ncbi:MAG: hypothetical protein KGI55_01820, partial [Gammaproteobacteria bacterium]|nr:hypothetical protein [Gammaproteobacteria bacterium]
MTNEKPTNTWSSVLPGLAAVAALGIAAAAVLTLLARAPGGGAAPGDELSLVLQRIPFEAGNALRGDPLSFDELGRTLAREATLRGQVTGGADAADWRKLDTAVGT